MTDVEERLRRLLADGRLDLPLPGGGATRERWRGLHDLAASEELSVARLAEAHADAVAIVAEAGLALPAGDDGGPAFAGVWASRYGGRDLFAVADGGGWRVSGELAFCSGAPMLDLALVDPALPDGRRQLLIIPLRTDGIRVARG
ncbi:MAG: acyl-CoA dehydrogenase, partial [Ilumatobacteraceae bacterium]